MRARRFVRVLCDDGLAHVLEHNSDSDEEGFSRYARGALSHYDPKTRQFIGGRPAAIVRLRLMTSAPVDCVLCASGRMTL